MTMYGHGVEVVSSIQKLFIVNCGFTISTNPFGKIGNFSKRCEVGIMPVLHIHVMYTTLKGMY